MPKKKVIRIRTQPVKLVGLITLALLTLSIFLIVLFVQRQQTFRQEAQTSGTTGLPTFTSLLDLEQQLLHNPPMNADGKPRDSRFPIGYEDYNLCPDAAPSPENNNPGRMDSCDSRGVTWTTPPPGAINLYEAKCLANQYVGNPEGGGACDSNGDGEMDESHEPWFFYGTVGNSTDPNDPFYTDGPANVQARLVGDCNHRAAHCTSRGCQYYAYTGPATAAAGGWNYNNSQDEASYTISTWEGARIGWTHVMDYAQRKITERYNRTLKETGTGRLMDRRCALSVAVIEAREELRRDGKNPSTLGFTPRPFTGTAGGGGSNTAPMITIPPTDTPVPTLPNPVTPQTAAESMRSVVTGIALIGGAVAAWYLWPL